MDKEGILNRIKLGHWDYYRLYYSSLSFSEKKWLHENWQSYINKTPAYNMKMFKKFFAYVSEKEEHLNVIELGCRDGSLAEHIINEFENEFEINYWIGYDIVGEARSENILQINILFEPFYRIESNILDMIFLCSHTIEHLDTREVKELFEAVNTKYIMIEAPLNELGHNWQRYNGGHVLRLGRKDICDMLRLEYELKEEVVNIKDRFEIWNVLFERRKQG